MPAIHYLIRVKLIRFVEDGEIDFIYDEKTFKESNPIIARENAFSYYNSYIDTILEPNLSHSEIAERLSEKIKRENVEFGNEIISYRNIQSGIGVFLVIDEPINSDVKDEEYLVHGIGFTSGESDIIMDSLINENAYYEHYNFETSNHRITVNFFDGDFDEHSEEIILQTPFDWEALYLIDTSSQNLEETKSNVEVSPRVDLIREKIADGESNTIEFKSSLVSYLNQEGKIGYSRHIKFKIIKTIASFLNSNGGLLFVGIKDDKSILGLESDFSLAQSKTDNPKDYFKLEVDKIIRENFKAVATFISGEFIELEEKQVYLFIVEPSSKPVFVYNNTDKEINAHKKEFYVRLAGASSVLYTEIDDIAEYCVNHWNRK